MTTSFITSHPSLVVVANRRACELCVHDPSRKQLGSFISISDPPPDTKRPNVRFLRRITFRVELDFDDTEREGGDVDVVAPTESHIKHIIEFGQNFHHWKSDAKLLIHCFAGRSRSTAAAFIILCDRLGAGREVDAMTELLTACEKAPLPNMLMVRHADKLLDRHGAMVRVAQRQNDSPEDAECEGGKYVTGTALLAAVKRGEL